MYIDGFLLPVRKDRVEEYRAMAEIGREVWLEHGATGYVEAIADDVPHGEHTSFPRAVQLTDEEIVFLSWITYPDRATRDRCIEKVIADDRFKPFMTGDMPFDGRRMISGGFEAFVTA